MLHRCHAAGVKGAVAHCNFGLRGAESDGDEAFVREKAAEFNFPVHTVRFETAQYAAQHGISIQMAARELRYQWFDELATRYRYDTIAIAHNRDDKIETLFINLARGTGIKGLASIRPRNGKIVRPLLSVSREEIVAYVQREQVAFREDSSNTGDKYARNYIRHHLIPGLEAFFPGFRTAIERDMAHFADVEAFYQESVARWKQQVCAADGDLLYIDLPKLLDSPAPCTLLFEILRTYGFAHAVAQKVLQAADHPGRRFYSGSHRLLCDRQRLILQTLSQEDAQEYPIDLTVAEWQGPVQLNISRFDVCTGYRPDTSPDIACIDGDQLQEPLLLRRWQAGDRFRPLGMQQMKKLSDFFIDQKLSLFEKEKIWLLTAAGQIVWVVGHRIDDRYKISKNSTHGIQFRLTHNIN
jgi:tRNA(Ile)-lysidine synthase